MTSTILGASQARSGRCAGSGVQMVTTATLLTASLPLPRHESGQRLDAVMGWGSVGSTRNDSFHPRDAQANALSALARGVPARPSRAASRERPHRILPSLR